MLITAIFIVVLIYFWSTIIKLIKAVFIIVNYLVIIMLVYVKIIWIHEISLSPIWLLMIIFIITIFSADLLIFICFQIILILLL